MDPLMNQEIPPTASTEASLLIAFTRMEAKVDVALAQHASDLKNQGANITDHEARLRTLETTPTVSPRVLWTTVASALGLMFAAYPIFERFISH